MNGNAHTFAAGGVSFAGQVVEHTRRLAAKTAVRQILVLEGDSMCFSGKSENRRPVGADVLRSTRSPDTIGAGNVDFGGCSLQADACVAVACGGARRRRWRRVGFGHYALATTVHGITNTA
jgi:hypothetical protein